MQSHLFICIWITNPKSSLIHLTKVLQEWDSPVIPSSAFSTEHLPLRVVSSVLWCRDLYICMLWVCDWPDLVPSDSGHPSVYCNYQYDEYHDLGSSVVRSLATGTKCPGFNFLIAQHVQILISRAFMYGAVGSLVLRWSWARQSGFISFSIELVLGPDNLGSFPSCCLWIQMYNNLGQKVVCLHCALAHQAIHPFSVGKLVLVISQGNNA